MTTGNRRADLVAWSNAAYIIAGVASWDPLFLVLMVNLGISSFAYHSGWVKWGGRADVAAMYATFAGLIQALIAPWWVALIFAGLIMFLAFDSAWLQSNIHVKVGAAWMLFMIALLGHHPDASLLLMGTITFAIGFASWRTDPGYERWGHAFWHITTAIGFMLLRLSVLR